MSSPRFLPVSVGEPAVEALENVISEAKDGDPLAPATVIVPSNYSGLSMRRTLGRRGGLLNVGFMVENRLAELLGGGRIEGKSGPLTRPLRSEAVRGVLQHNPGSFADAVGHASTVRALEITFDELRHASDSELDALAGSSRRGAEVVRLYRDFRQRTMAYYDLEDLYLAAAAFVETTPGALRDIGHTALFLPREQSPGQIALLRAIQRKGQLSVVAGLTGDPDADEDIHDLTKTLTGDPMAVTANVDPSIGAEVLAAADADEEVRNVIRLIGRELENPGGARLHRIAVAYPARDTYATICSELFAASGIPVNGPGDRTLAQSLAGRTVLGLLSLPAADFSRGAVMDLLSLPVTLPVGARRYFQRWDVLSREAGVTRGLENWRMRLQFHAKRLRSDAAAQPEDRETLANRLESDAAHCDELLACVEALAQDAAFPGEATWPGYSDRIVALLERYLPDGHLEDDEALAHGQVMDLLRELGSLEAVNHECSPDAFVRMAEQQLQKLWGRAGNFDDGVFVAPISQMRGTSFDLVFILGMVEGALPRPPREDPLLPDHERAAMPSLRKRADARLRRDRDAFLASCAAAPRRVLSFPAADLRGQRKNLPSRWLLDVCSKLADRSIFTAQFEALVENHRGVSWFHAVPSLESGLSSPLPAGNQKEHELRRLIAAGQHVEGHPFVTQVPLLDRGFAAIRARRGREFTEWDGFTGPADRLEVSANPTSPTRLENWATCGFRYYLASVLGVQPTREPDDELRITPLDRGSLIHAVLERFFKAHGARKHPGEPWNDFERAELRAMAEEACLEADASGVTGKPLLWRLEKDLLLGELDAVLDLDQDLRAGKGARFVDAEYAFGSGKKPHVEVKVGARTLQFRGKIDRVDRTDDGTVIIYDYKTGSTWGYDDVEDEPLGKGRRLQLPIYALAARARFGATAVRAAYWFTRPGTSDNPRELPLDEDPSAMLLGVLDPMAEGIANGVFPIRPGEPDKGSFRNCKFCDYKRLCPANRLQNWKRKASAPELEGYISLVEGSGLLAGEDSGDGSEE